MLLVWGVCGFGFCFTCRFGFGVVGLYLLPDLTRFACLDLAVVTCAWLVGLVVFTWGCGDDALVATFCFGVGLVFAVGCGFVWCCVCWLFS